MDFVNIGVPGGGASILPPGYVETEALGFFRKRFNRKGTSLKEIAFNVISSFRGVRGYSVSLGQ